MVEDYRSPSLKVLKKIRHAQSFVTGFEGISIMVKASSFFACGKVSVTETATFVAYDSTCSVRLLPCLVAYDPLNLWQEFCNEPLCQRNSDQGSL